MIELEDAVMEIIVNAGQSRSLCFEALHAARTGNIDEARLLLNALSVHFEFIKSFYTNK